MTEMITSTANPQIKAARKLADRRERQAGGLYLAEGLRIAIEAIQQGSDIQKIIHAPDLLRSHIGWEKIAEFEQQHPDRVLQVSESVFSSLAQKDHPQGVAVVIRQSWHELDDIRLIAGSLWVALDQVADPGNLGTILRSLDGVNADGIILLDQCTDPYDPSAIRASMGAVLTRKLVKTSFDKFKKWAQENGVSVVGTSDKADRNFHDYRYPNPMILMMGSERQGLDVAHQELCSAMISIPMRGKNDSLNLAVATGIVLYEIDHQRHIKGKESR